jgi:hypothetical protein
MPSSLFTIPMRIRDLFSDDYLFTVPGYQRPYSWQLKQAEQLFDDLIDAHNNETIITRGEPYFLGTLLMIIRPGMRWDPDGPLPPGTPQQPRDLDIVDGQQRIVTLSILLAILRDLAADAAEAPKATKRVADQALAICALLERLITPERNRPGAEAPSARVAISERHRALFESHVRPAGASRQAAPGAPLGPAETAMIEVRDFFRAACLKLAVEERLRFAGFLVDKCLFVLIVARNIDQGHRIFTVLNDRGLDLETQDIVKAEVLSAFRGDDGKAAEQAWDDAASRVVDAHDAKEQKNKRFSEFFSHIRTIYGQHKAPVIVGVRTVVREVGGEKPFLKDVVEPYSAVVELILKANHAGSADSTEINRRLTYLGWQRSADWMPSTMLWLKIHRDDPARTLAFLKVMERFAYSLRLQCLATNKRATRFQPLIQAIRDNPEVDPRQLPVTLDDRERRHIWSNLTRLHDRNAQTCKLLLLRLNDEIAGGLQGLDPEDYNVEHILPKNPPAASEWQRLFAQPDLRDRSIQALGNLTLVTKSQNDRASNKDFAGKKAIYFESRTPPLALTLPLAEATEWGPDQLEARTQLLMGYLKQMWQIDETMLGTGADD